MARSGRRVGPAMGMAGMPCGEVGASGGVPGAELPPPLGSAHGTAARPRRTPPAPAVQKLRIRYAKRGRLRFSSTRDFQRALERALRRAGVPMAFSAGFHPHPKISYANAAPTGTASEAEYFEISVTERVDPESVRRALDEALPDGLDVLEVVEAAPGCAGRPAAGQRLGRWTSRASPPSELQRAADQLPRARAGRGHPHLQDRAEDLRREIGRRVDDHRAVRSGPTVRYFGWSYGTPHRPYAPTTS